MIRLPQSLNWKYAIAEVALIVTGVLIAMGAGALVQAGNDREKERAYLRQLTADLEQTEDILRAALEADGATASSVMSILRVLQSQKAFEQDSLKRWVQMAPMGYSDPRLVLGTITALQETGDLSLLQNDSIRTAVSAYASLVQADQAELSRWIERTLNAADRYQHRGVRGVRTYPIDDFESNAMVEMDMLFLPAVREDPEIRVAFDGIHIAVQNRLFYLRRMRQATVTLRQLIGT